MTRYGWDASNHDWPRGPMNLTQARADGIDLFTHKSTEGSTFEDPYFDEAMTRAQAANFPVVGAYHVLWPNNPATQADFWLNIVNARAPWWRQHPCWIFQIDAELFQEFNPYRPPTVAEINACGDRIVAQSGCKPSQVVVYAPEWLYKDSLSGLKYRCLWASSYVTGSGDFKKLYPGDGSNRWDGYSTIEPTILQYTSTATIAGQSPCDANAVRVATVADLQALFLEGDDMTPEQEAKLDAIISGLGVVVRGDEKDPPTGDTHPDNLQRIRGDLGAVGRDVAAVKAQVAALQSAVSQLGAGGTVDYAKVQAAAEAALASLHLEVTPSAPSA